jgi:hypothetical protein
VSHKPRPLGNYASGLVNDAIMVVSSGIHAITPVVTCTCAMTETDRLRREAQALHSLEAAKILLLEVVGLDERE